MSTIYSVSAWGDGGMGRWGDGEIGRWGDSYIYLLFTQFFVFHIHINILGATMN
ncbi:MAG: hypothetical protein F6K54_33020 [Okeania sp. SIO3B5]|uniref:hypothetical protein n=1 Tax=Okeania sp. SIO3B5 TaxID=2607811 RepID=UPI0013FF479E|nr:hypothetical protein [Okeania sp. SIO3B5]NEO57476.1 hypothetical protein [Okeania sp. SIO3B5]